MIIDIGGRIAVNLERIVMKIEQIKEGWALFFYVGVMSVPVGKVVTFVSESVPFESEERALREYEHIIKAYNRGEKVYTIEGKKEPEGIKQVERDKKGKLIYVMRCPICGEIFNVAPEGIYYPHCSHYDKALEKGIQFSNGNLVMVVSVKTLSDYLKESEIP